MLVKSILKNKEIQVSLTTAWELRICENIISPKIKTNQTFLSVKNSSVLCDLEQVSYNKLLLLIISEKILSPNLALPIIDYRLLINL